MFLKPIAVDVWHYYVSMHVYICIRINRYMYIHTNWCTYVYAYIYMNLYSYVMFLEHSMHPTQKKTKLRCTSVVSERSEVKSRASKCRRIFMIIYHLFGIFVAPKMCLEMLPEMLPKILAEVLPKMPPKCFPKCSPKCSPKWSQKCSPMLPQMLPEFLKRKNSN